MSVARFSATTTFRALPRTANESRSSSEVAAPAFAGLTVYQCDFSCAFNFSSSSHKKPKRQTVRTLVTIPRRSGFFRHKHETFLRPMQLNFQRMCQFQLLIFTFLFRHRFFELRFRYLKRHCACGVYVIGGCACSGGADRMHAQSRSESSRRWLGGCRVTPLTSGDPCDPCDPVSART